MSGEISYTEKRERDRFYFDDVKKALYDDRLEGVIEEELADWFRKLKREITSDYRKFLYNEIMKSEIMTKGGLSL